MTTEDMKEIHNKMEELKIEDIRGLNNNEKQNNENDEEDIDENIDEDIEEDIEEDIDEENEEEEKDYELVLFKYWFEGCKTIDEVLSGIDVLKETFEQWKKEGHELVQEVDTGYCYIDKICENEEKIE
jgi:hypothetical protein